MGRPSFTIQDKDLGFDDLVHVVKSFKARGEDHVVVGIPYSNESEQADGGTKVIDYAIANEFGATINHPGGTSYGYRTERDAKAGKVRFLKTGTGFQKLGVTGPHKIVIPARPFIRQPFDKNQEKLKKAAAQLLGHMLDGKITKRTALEVLGDTFLAEIRLAIERREFEPNAASTIRKKKSDKPLVGESGRLQQSLKYEVR